MRTLRFLLPVALLLSGLIVKAQDNTTILEYISTYKELAIAEMQRTGVPASIKLAQGIHETLAGTSPLVRKSNNHFGIKCKSSWTGESVSHDDDARGECFRKYSSPEDSYKDHSNFLKGSARYASLFSLDPLDYKEWANGLKKAGYATNPRYPQVIIKLIEDYHLQDYSLIALGKMKTGDEVFVKAPAPGNETPAPVAAVVRTTAPPAQAPPVAEEKINYPSGEFRINDTKVVFVRKGTSLLSIAQQYNVPLARIFEFNEMEETEALEQDQLIYLQRKRKTGENDFHVVKTGESLQDIARKEAIRLESLLEYNYLAVNSRPVAGEQLYLRKKAPAAPRLEN
ncbi:MAG: glucosaminidase domain-containing protein [Chitinophagaceae bacterium]